MSDLIPKPGEIRARLERIEQERRDLRRLLRMAERCHGEAPTAEAPQPVKLETK